MEGGVKGGAGGYESHEWHWGFGPSAVNSDGHWEFCPWHWEPLVPQRNMPRSIIPTHTAKHAHDHETICGDAVLRSTTPLPCKSVAHEGSLTPPREHGPNGQK